MLTMDFSFLMERVMTSYSFVELSLTNLFCWMMREDWSIETYVFSSSFLDYGAVIGFSLVTDTLGCGLSFLESELLRLKID